MLKPIPIKKYEKIIGTKGIYKLVQLSTLPDEGQEILNKLYLHTRDIVQRKLIEYIFEIKEWKLEIPELEEDPDPPRYA